VQQKGKVSSGKTVNRAMRQNQTNTSLQEEAGKGRQKKKDLCGVLLVGDPPTQEKERGNSWKKKRAHNNTVKEGRIEEKYILCAGKRGTVGRGG